MVKKSKNREDKLARMIQREFAAIHKRFDETASRGEVVSIKEGVERLREDMEIFRKDTAAAFLAVTHTLKAIQEELKDLRGLDLEVASLRVRLARVERKIGLTR